MQYGLPYKGSKSRIAPEIISHLPAADTLYDLFAGGCAITHAALESGKWNKIVASDITPYPCVFARAIAGEYRDDKRWCSREDFFKTDDPLTKVIFSFGNDCRTYIYAEDLVPFKKACHDAVVSLDFEPLKTFGYDVSAIAQYADFEARRMALKRVLDDAGTDKGKVEHLERLGRVQHLERLGRVKKLGEMQHLEALGRVQHLETIQSDYRDVEITGDAVIYCDIPYRETNGYGKKRMSDFDYDPFYEWALNQTAPIFISEYWMPDDFEIIWEGAIQSKINAERPKKMVERIFVPRGQDTPKTTLF